MKLCTIKQLSLLGPPSPTPSNHCSIFHLCESVYSKDLR